MVTWYPLSKTLDTMEATDIVSTDSHGDMLSFNDLKRETRRYVAGQRTPHYPVPATIGIQETRWAVYLFDTVKGYDAMPLFRGYTWSQWVKS